MRLKTVGVIGAGTSGKGIIRSLAGAGLSVIFTEISQTKADQALEEIREALDREIARWWITESEKKLMLSRISATSDVRKMAGAQVVIEAIPGDLEDKAELFEELDRVFSPEVVLISNSSTLCISEIAKGTRHPERVVAVHFSIPVPRRPIVEIVEGLHTSRETLDTVRALARAMGKTTLEVFEMPGLITTRIMVPYINEAMHIVMEGLATPDQVDQALRLGFKLPIGPLMMADQVGLDTLLRDMQRLFKALGELQYRPCPLLRRMVREGKLGVKTSEGFFKYDSEGRVIETP